MKVQLIYPSIDLPYQINHGITAIAAALKSMDHSVGLLHFTKYKRSVILNKIKQYRPDVVAFSVCENQWEMTKTIAADIKKNYDSKIPIFVGGPAPSAHQGFICETKTIHHCQKLVKVECEINPQRTSEDQAKHDAEQDEIKDKLNTYANHIYGKCLIKNNLGGE